VAFCNSCGASLAATDKFCPKCGGSVQGSAVSPAAGAAPAMAPAAKPSSGARVILIVVLVVVGFFVLAIAGIGIVGWQIARHSRVQKNGEQVKVETPFGTVESSKDVDATIKNLGIDVYPGAEAREGGASTATFGGIHTVSAQFETDDPPDKVAEFYKSRLPNAQFSSQGEHYSIVATENKTVTTISIFPQDGKTLIAIANVAK
jgi:hypothetical protein